MGYNSCCPLCGTNESVLIGGSVYKREDRYVTVTDDWYPCYEGNKVLLSVFMMYPDECNKKCVVRPYALVKVMASGNDDTYVEKEYGIKFDGERYVEYEWTRNGSETINRYLDDSGDMYKSKAEMMYEAWKRDIFECVPNGVDRQWFLENGFHDGI